MNSDTSKECSEYTADTRTGKFREDLKKATTRKLTMTATRQMMTELVKRRVGTADVEEKAFQLVKD